jgi:multisubunit Na+/H+ antiporter MnhG subunit
MNDVILFLGVIYILYGLLGLVGVQRIPQEFRHRSWTARYKRVRGVGWLILGVPWCVLYLLIRSAELPRFVVVLLLIACSLPGIVWSYRTERSYRARIEKEDTEE